MDPELLLSGGLPAILLAGIAILWREWQSDRKKAEERYTAALHESREDAKAMHELVTNLGKATDAIADMNANSTKLDQIIKYLVEKSQ